MRTAEQPGEGTARARAWQHAAQAAVCDVIRPWAHGTVVRATLYPGYFDCNVVRVEDDVPMDFEELASFADEALAGLAHRRVDFELPQPAERLRRRFERAGWLTMRLLWMRQEEGALAASGQPGDVAEVPYDAVADLRVAWQREDFPDQDASGHRAEAREVALRRDARVFAARERGVPVGFAQLERVGSAAEITQVYMDPDHRGRGLGSAVTAAAIRAAGDAEDLWICADDEGRPKRMYARLGFRPAWRSMQFLRLPRRGA